MKRDEVLKLSIQEVFARQSKMKKPEIATAMLRFSLRPFKGAALQPVVPSAQPGAKGGSAQPVNSTALGGSLLGRSGLLGRSLLHSDFFLCGSFCHGISLSQIVRIISNKSTMHNFYYAVDI